MCKLCPRVDGGFIATLYAGSKSIGGSRAQDIELQRQDFQASRATVSGGELSEYRYVHFATHGWLDSERPGLSALVLSMVDQQGKPEDGFLRANDTAAIAPINDV